MINDVRKYIESETELAADLLKGIAARLSSGDVNMLEDAVREYVYHRFLIFDADYEPDESFEYLGTFSIYNTLMMTGGDLDAAGVITGCGGQTTWVHKKAKMLFSIQDACEIRFDPMQTARIKTIADLSEAIVAAWAKDKGLSLPVAQPALPLSPHSQDHSLESAEASPNQELEQFRAQYSYLGAADAQKPVAYLDNAATMQIPQSVVIAMQQFCNYSYANVHRGVYGISERATAAYEHARESVARFINAKPAEVVFTSGTTAGINMVAHALAPTLKAGDRIVVTQMEHHSNYLPWLELCREKGLVFEVAPVTESGDIDFGALTALLQPPTKVLAMTQCSNVTGALAPVASACALASGKGIVTVVDGAQGVRHGRTDMRGLGCDFYVFSGHKLGAGPGIGVLYGKEAVMGKLRAPMVGGGVIADLIEDNYTPEPLPWGWEAGTPNIVGAVALEEALSFRKRIGEEHIRELEHALLGRLVKGLEACDNVTILGCPKQRSGCVSFVVDGMDASECSRILNERGIAVRSGHHCAIPLHRALGVESSVRVSPAFYNSMEEIERFLECVRELKPL